MAKIPRGDGTVNSFTEVVRGRRESGQSATQSFFGSVKDKLREKTDPRRMLPQGGLLTALFPNLKAYKAGPQKGERLSSPSPADAIGASEPALQALQMNTMMAAKNSLVLPAIHKDINLMRQNIAKLVKVFGGKPATKVDKDFFKSKDRDIAYKVQTSPTATKESETPEEKKGVLGQLVAPIIASIKAVVDNIKTAIGDAVSGAINLLMKGLKGAFSLGKIGLRALWPLLGRLLAFFVSPAGLAIIFAASFIALMKGLDSKVYAGGPGDMTNNPAVMAYMNPDENERKKQNLLQEQKSIWSQYETGLTATQKWMPGRQDAAQQKMHLEKIGWDDATSTTKAQRDAAIAENKGKVVAVGDSLAVGVAGSTKDTESVAKSGLSPRQILSEIGKKISENPNYFRGKKVILSSGISNSAVDKDGVINKADFDAVKSQIELLKGAGAESIELLGVGTNSKFEKSDANTKLQALADGRYVRFSDISGMTFDRGGIHPTGKGYKDIYNRAITAPPVLTPSAANTGEAVDNSSRTASDKPPTVVDMRKQSDSTEEEQDEISNFGEKIGETFNSDLTEYLNPSK